MKRRSFLELAALAALGPADGWAVVSGPLAGQLGATLTPLGAEKVGNASGTVPAWVGGLPKSSMKRGDNPFAADKPLFTITSANVEKYGRWLTEGHKALFKTFPSSYFIPVYPSRRSASYPQWYYDATIKNATRVSLANHGNNFTGTAHGAPFPIPQNGTEVMWNHIMRYNTTGYSGYVNSAITQTGGSYVIERDYLELLYLYNNPKTTLATLDGQNLYAMVKTLSPPNKAGTSDLLRVPIDRIAHKTGVWEYNTALGRVRRIGKVGYDNPLFDGLMTEDQLDMFNGPLDRYTVKLVGKRDMLVPYNSYALYSPKLKYSQIVKKDHINQALTRYEMHRVWVLEAELRSGYSHIYKKRNFYFDEDSWLILLEDMYDDRNQFWRTAEAHAICFAEVPVVVNGVQVHYDLQSRRYVIVNMTNEESRMATYNWQKEPSYFTPQQLQIFATAGNA